MNRLLRVWILVCASVGIAFFLSQVVEIPYRSALRGYDNTFNYLWLRSAMVDGDWDFRNDLAACNTLTSAYREAALALPRTPVGRIPNKYGVGWAVLTLPFYLLADGIVAGGNTLGFWSLPRDGFNAVYQGAIQAGHFALSILALWLAIQTVSRWIGQKRAAIAGVFTVWAASPLLYYQTANVSMSHAAAFFSVTIMAYALTCTDEVPRKAWPWLLAGMGWGLAVTTRYQLAVFGLILVSGVVRSSRKHDASEAVNRPSILRRAGLIVTGAAPFLSIQVWAWHVVYGRWILFSYGNEGEAFNWARPELIKSLLSPWHGLFYWHPFLLVGVAGVVGWCRAAPRIVVPWAVAIVLTIYVDSAWWCWWFGSSFGGRSFDAALLPLMAGAAWILLCGRPILRRTFWCCAVAAAIWNFYVAVLYRTGAISRSEPVTWSQMVDAAPALRNAIRF